jgi:hypothetical protein
MNQEPWPTARSICPTGQAEMPVADGKLCAVLPAWSVYWHTVQLCAVAASTVVGFIGKQKLPPM